MEKSRVDGRPMWVTYLAVIVVEVLVLVGLWFLGRSFGSF